MYLPAAVQRGVSIAAREAGLATRDLVSRQYYTTRCNGSYYSYNYNCHSAWYRFGRWILAGVLIFLGLLLILIALCCAQRRKRRNRKLATTQAPMTSAPVNSGYGNDVGYGSQTQYAPPAGAPPPGYGGANEGYYGQQGGVTQPQSAHQK